MNPYVPWLITVLPLVALLMTVLNTAVWPRGRAATRGKHRVSVLIPARNEEDSIERAVRSALANGADEVSVYDDGSTDATPSILAALAAEDDRVRVVPAVDLPDGWVGKPHACSRLGRAATGDLLVFLDADVELNGGGLGRIEGIFEDYQADVVTLVPRQHTGSIVEHLILPLLHVTYVSWLPLPLIWRTNDPRFLAANGQVLAVSRPAYDAVGGFGVVAHSVVDDMEFCAAHKRLKHRVVFADGHDVAACRMYGSAGEVWSGFSKNIREGVGSTIGVFGVVFVYLAAFVWPWVAWTLGAEWVLPAAIGVGANLAQRLLLGVRHQHHPLSVAAHPVAVLGLLAIALNSVRWNYKNSIEWAGRSYVRKEQRRG